MKRIIYTNDKGGVSVVIPVDDTLTIEELAARTVPVGVAYKIVEDTDLPADRTFRNAWDFDGESVTVNATKAKVIAAATKAENDIRASALKKLAALGLTADEIAAL